MMGCPHCSHICTDSVDGKIRGVRMPLTTTRMKRHACQKTRKDVGEKMARPGIM
jgi:hypothetical protein